MEFKLMDEVDYNGTEKVSLKNWRSEFEFWSSVAKLEQEMEDCLEEPIFDDPDGYCEFFNGECSRCSLSKYKVGLKDECDITATDVLCNEYGGVTMGCLMSQDHESLPSAVDVRIEALRRDSIRWGYCVELKE